MKHSIGAKPGSGPQPRYGEARSHLLWPRWEKSCGASIHPQPLRLHRHKLNYSHQSLGLSCRASPTNPQSSYKTPKSPQVRQWRPKPNTHTSVEPRRVWKWRDSINHSSTWMYFIYQRCLVPILDRRKTGVKVGNHLNETNRSQQIGKIWYFHNILVDRLEKWMIGLLP